MSQNFTKSTQSGRSDGPRTILVHGRGGVAVQLESLMENRSISTLLPKEMNGLFGIDREPRSIGSFARQFLQWRAPKLSPSAWANSSDQILWMWGKPTRAYCGMTWRIFSRRSLNRIKQAKSLAQDISRFGEPWTPKRLMRRGQIRRRLEMKHLLLFRRWFEAEGLAPNGRRKKTSCLINAEIEKCPGSK